MHLLQTQPGAPPEGEAVDLGQDAAEIVILSAADTELGSLSAALDALPGDFPSVRLANWLQLRHPMSVDLYLEQVVEQARVVVVRLLGGSGYWAYGVERLEAVAREKGIALALLPGDDQPDGELLARSTVDATTWQRLWGYGIHGGMANAREWLLGCAALAGREVEWLNPTPLARAGFYWPGEGACTLERVAEHWNERDRRDPVVAITFYRALLQGGDLAPVDALCDALRAEGLDPLPVFVSSLKDPTSAALLSEALHSTDTQAALNLTGFACATPGADTHASPLDACGGPVLQVVLSSETEQTWAQGTHGLPARDIAMQAALPEVDGRLFTRAVSFKAQDRFDARAQVQVVRHRPRADRIAFVARLAAAWVRLRRSAVPERRVGIVMANYPNKDGRLGNGVGLDTPASAIVVLQRLRAAGYAVSQVPADGDALIRLLAAGPTNAGVHGREITERLSLVDYNAAFAALPESVRSAVNGRWGPPSDDPLFIAGQASFAIAARRFGQVVCGIQPARGYQIDPVASYHDPALVPPHGYLAFYIWLREAQAVHAVIHLGKHGNMEWLPGRSLALGEGCFPEAVFGALPHLYPFIVNDPGEGTQAKRRAQAVIIDHLTPPLARAGSEGALAELEMLVDEYFEASTLDPRRLPVLARDIRDALARTGLDIDCGIKAGDDDATALAALDGYLCELKELQIRDGLHIFGQSPAKDLTDELLVALARLPRANGQGKGEGEAASLTQALAADLGLGEFDPLDCEMGATWQGPKPPALQDIDTGSAWRTAGDTVERIEQLALALVAGPTARRAGPRREPQRADSHQPPPLPAPSATSQADAAAPAATADAVGRQAHRAPADPPAGCCGFPRTAAVLGFIETRLRPAVAACGEAELDGLLTGLDGRFVAPGPSGAPTRGRPEVLPTGRNFYSVDTRAVPTPAAWRLGFHSASLVIERYRQEEGEWPRRLALSAWGTANMRTGGDDLAQALALLGVQPSWDAASGRVTGFEVMPVSVLDRPRVDVTLRVSGFFRDAFPAQIALFDSAVRAVAALDESDQDNPVIARVRGEREALMATGVSAEDAEMRAGLSVFGSKPGSYGAGLQALIDERGWETDDDLARAYLAWGGYAYGEGASGRAEHAMFERRLRDVQLVLHNQDNREHDLLDSDDYYQFEGGITAAVRTLSGRQPAIYHNDHSNPAAPRIRTLEEEIGRVVRARVTNPRWIRGVMRHGYKGAFEIAATVDYLFAFAATARVVHDHHFEAVYDAFVVDEQVADFMREHNPAAFDEMRARLREALERELWKPRSNAAHERLADHR